MSLTMTQSNPTATALKNFLEKLGPGVEKRVARVIAEKFNIAEHSSEFHLLLSIQARNFSRLRYQVEAADFRATAKRSYLAQIESLSMVTRYDILSQRFDQVKPGHLDAHIVVLGYLEDAIRVAPELSAESIEELKKVADQVAELRKELVNLALPIGVRTSLEEQLDELVFSLRNYDCIGPVSVWNQASMTTATIYKDAHVANTPESHATLGKLAAILGLVIGAVAATDNTLGHIESIMERGVKIGGHLKSGYEMIESWKPKPPQIEYKPKRPNPPDGLDV